jgi:hypothetical protein
MKIIKTKVYEFDELPDEAKERAIINEAIFYNEIDYRHLPDCIKRAVDKAEAMQTPWFTTEYILDDCRSYLIDTIKLNNYTFTIEGKMFN